MKRFWITALVMLALVTGAYSQNCVTRQATRNVSWYISPLPNATIRVCSYPSSGIPCTPLQASLYSDASLSQQSILQNPFNADSNGNYTFCLQNPAIVDIQVYTTTSGTQTFHSITVGGGSGNQGSGLPADWVVTGSGSFEYVKVPGVFNAVGPLQSGTPSTSAKQALSGGGNGLVCDETSVAGTPAPGVEYVRCDSTAHAFMYSQNGGPEVPLATGVTQFAFTQYKGILTPSLPIFQMQVGAPFTVPANGTILNCTSRLSLGALPLAPWTATIYRYPAATAGCFTSTPLFIGTVTVDTTGADHWSVSATDFNSGDCYQLVTPSVQDQTASKPQLAQCVVKK